jgi:hypothetical protein
MPSPVVNRPSPAPVQHYEPVSQPAANSTFIGIQSARDARTYSERGQQSMQTINRSAPVSRPAMPASGGHGSNPPRR